MAKEIIVNVTDKISPKIKEMTENNKKIIALLGRNAELTLKLMNSIHELVD